MTKHDAKLTASRGKQQTRRSLPWPVWAALGGLVLLAAGLVFLSRPGTQAASEKPLVTRQPKLVVNQDKIDFGTVPLGKPVEATFKLTNVGDQPLEIEGQPTIQVLKGC
jgi:hypothetical protein